MSNDKQETVVVIEDDEAEVEVYVYGLTPEGKALADAFRAKIEADKKREAKDG